MAWSLVDHVEVGFTDGGTANGSTGHDVVLPGGAAALAGDWDVIFVGSDTTVTTPTGFSVTQTFVNNQGGYLFTRKATGGESATVRVKTTGDFSTVVLWSRNRGLNLVDVSANAHVDSFGALTSPPVSTGTLASAVDTVIAGSTNTDASTVVPSGQSWAGSGFTEIGNATVGTGTALGWSTHAYKTPAGTAAEAPNVTWTTGNMRNRYIFVVAFTQASGTSVTINDTSGGVHLGGTADGLSITATKQDSSGGLHLGGTADPLSISSTKQDSSGGVHLGGTADPLSISSTKQDTSDGVALGGTADPLSISSTKQDGSGGVSLGTSGDTLSIGRVVVDSSGGVSLGGTNEVPTVAGNVTINDSSGGVSLGTSRDTVTTGSGVVHDTMVMPVLLNAMNCLRTEENKVPVPVAQYMIRPGATFTAMADQHADECCAGIAWVRPGAMWESDEFPNQRTDASRTEAAYYAVQVELGIIRCVPTVSNVTGNDDVPTEAQWLAATIAAMDDTAALRRTICCLREVYGEDFVVAGQITPLENEGNCAGVTTVVTMRVPACDCVE